MINLKDYKNISMLVDDCESLEDLLNTFDEIAEEVIMLRREVDRLEASQHEIDPYDYINDIGVSDSDFI